MAILDRVQEECLLTSSDFDYILTLADSGGQNYIAENQVTYLFLMGFFGTAMAILTIWLISVAVKSRSVLVAIGAIPFLIIVVTIAMDMFEGYKSIPENKLEAERLEALLDEKQKPSRDILANCSMGDEGESVLIKEMPNASESQVIKTIKIQR